MLTLKKKIIFSIIPLVGVLLILVLIEFSLRMFVSSSDDRLVSEVTYDGIEWYQINRGYLKKYFSINDALVPEFRPSLFRKHKQASTIRLMCLGESSMFGTPYEMTCNIPGILRKQLRHILPEKEIEVINLGASAINSNVIRDLSPELLAFEPDVVCIYMGHNEFYGPDGIGASWLQKHFSFAIPLGYRLRESRLVQLLLSSFRSSQHEGGMTQEQNLMKQVSEGNNVVLESEDARRIFNLFESNLKDIVGVFEKHRVPVIVSDVSSNLDFPPFVYDTIHATTNINSILREAERDYASGRFEQARGFVDKAEVVDPSNAMVHYWQGKICLASGKTEEARKWFERARDNDLLKFRAPGRINEIIRDVCASEHVPFVSADSALSTASPLGIPGGNVFWEHLHPNAYGYYLIAQQFFHKMIEARLFSEIGRPLDMVHELPFQLDTLSVCWLDLAYADLSIKHLTSRWPFTEYHRESVVLNEADKSLQQIVLDVYARKLVWDEACYKAAELFWARGAIRYARTIYEALLEEYPYNFYTHYLLGNLLTKTGNVAEGIKHYRSSIASNPRYPNAHLDLGLLEINNGEFDEAIKELQAALVGSSAPAMRGLRANVYYGLSAAHANKGDFEEALAYVDEALKLLPTYREALSLRESIQQHHK